MVTAKLNPWKWNWDLIGVIAIWLAGLAALSVLFTSCARADQCHHFFRKQVVYAAPIVAIPYVYHNASPGLVQEAQIRKAVREEVREELRQQLNQQQGSGVQRQTAQQPIAAFASCIKCHGGSTPAGGLVIDGVTPLPCDALLRWGEMAGLGVNVPPEMKALLTTMKPEQKGEVQAGLLRLVRQYVDAADRPRSVQVQAPEASGELK